MKPTLAKRLEQAEKATGAKDDEIVIYWCEDNPDGTVTSYRLGTDGAHLDEITRTREDEAEHNRLTHAVVIGWPEGDSWERDLPGPGGMPRRSRPALLLHRQPVHLS